METLSRKGDQPQWSDLWKENQNLQFSTKNCVEKALKSTGR